MTRPASPRALSGLLLIAFAVFVTPVAFAQSPATVAGHWEGTITLPGSGLPFLVDLVAPQGEGGWTGTVDFPTQGARGVVLEKVTVDGLAVTFQFPGMGTPTFQGKVEGDKLKGTFAQSGMTFPFEAGRGKVELPKRPQDPKPPFPYTAEEVTVTHGEIRLAGTLTVPPGAGPFPAVLLITGSGPQNRDEEIANHRPFAVMADHLTRAGIAVLRLDDRGVGGSSGDTMASTSADFADDALAAVAFLRQDKRVAPDRVGLVGHSEGGTVAPLAASRSKDVAFLVLLAGTGVPGGDLLHLQAGKLTLAAGGSPEAAALEVADMDKVVALLRAKMTDDERRKALRDHFRQQVTRQTQGTGMSAEVREQMAEAAATGWNAPWFRFFVDYDPRPALRQVKAPVLALNGELDAQVDADQNLTEIEKALREANNPNVTIKRLPGLNHLFQTAPSGAAAYYGVIEETIAPVVLDTVRDWILARGRKAP